MNDTTLPSPPSTLNAAARSGWTTPAETSPEPGDIWLLTWNLEPRGIILVTSVREDYILGMPITLDIDFASDQEAVLDGSVLGTEATLWFNAETGLGTFLLHRRLLSRAVDTGILSAYRRASRELEPATFRLGSARQEHVRPYRQELLEQYQSLCYLEWPAPIAGEAILNVDLIEERGMTGEDFAQSSGVATEQAFEMWIGQRVVYADVANLLAEQLGANLNELLIVNHDRVVQLLESPQFKERITVVAAETGIDEREIRNLARSSYALAARTDHVTGREETALIEALNTLRPGWQRK